MAFGKKKSHYREIFFHLQDYIQCQLEDTTE